MRNPIHADRSRLLEHQRCPRARYYAYEFVGRGIAPIKAAMPLITGQAVHAGRGHLLLHPDDVDGAVRAAHQVFDGHVSAKDSANDGADFTRTELEQRNLVEALVRAYHKQQLPKLLNDYRVREVEHEDVFPLAVVRYRGRKHRLELMARPDALLQERKTGDIYIDSLKTAANYDRRREAEAGHDVQGMSETAAVENRFAKWASDLERGKRNNIPEWFVELYETNGRRPPRVTGVRMEYVLKGERREDRQNPGQWIHNSPLIRGWRRRTATGWEYAWRWEWKEEDPDTGEIRNRRLGRDWEGFNVWDCDVVGGVKGWIDMLAAGKVQPEAGDCLAAQFIVPIPYYRNRGEIDAWVEQAAAQEARVAVAAARVNEASGPERRTLLNRHFPQHRRSCDWPTTCPFQEICFGSDHIAGDPLGSGLYVWREPHHDPERQQLQVAA